MSNTTYGGPQLAAAVKHAYTLGQDDYHLEPMVLTENDIPVGRITDKDAVIFCCRRGEREIELTEFFTDDNFNQVDRKKLDDLHFVIMTMYHEKFKALPIAFAPLKAENSLAQVLSNAGKTQFHCAESEKFAHVTFFFNGGENQPFPGETDVCIPSPKGIAFDQKPELSLPEVTKEVQAALGQYDFIVTNFANGDVIGHTQNTPAKLEACSCISRHLHTVIQDALSKGYVVAITADHGNIEKLYKASGKPDGAHTTNPVPFILIDPSNTAPIPLSDGALCDVAPTILDIMGIPKPAEMTGKSLAGSHFWQPGQKVLLVICDGWGLGTNDDNDAIHLADTAYWDTLLQTYPWSKLEASGTAVGLGSGKAGNSEAGHTNLGAGRCVIQDDVRLDAAVQDGSFKQNPVFIGAIDHAKRHNSALHLLAYLTHKSSHGCIDYPLSICEMARDANLDRVYLHIIFDGRSTDSGSAPALLLETDSRLQKIGVGRIVDGVGRGIALDRDKNYPKVKQAYDAMISGIGVHYS